MTPTDPALLSWAEELLDDARRVQQIVHAMAPLLVEAGEHTASLLRAGGQVFFFGNGGSAADAQHWAAELSGRFYQDRRPYPAHALTTNTSQLTAIGNDYGYEETFARPIRGMARPGDLAVGISTSGTSANVVRALEAARAMGVATMGFAGRDGGAMRDLCDRFVCIPVEDTARIQEGHELAAHVWLAVTERALFPVSG